MQKPPDCNVWMRYDLKGRAHVDGDCLQKYQMNQTPPTTIKYFANVNEPVYHCVETITNY